MKQTVKFKQWVIDKVLKEASRTADGWVRVGVHENITDIYNAQSYSVEMVSEPYIEIDDDVEKIIGTYTKQHPIISEKFSKYWYHVMTTHIEPYKLLSVTIDDDIFEI